ncbi:MAG TPA: NAD(+) synthase [Papillibacter sp.]|jgi:NAD+ synthase (glutamine-hydrolysing)|nr:NAD(+) synthase [Papillibacter sp.]
MKLGEYGFVRTAAAVPRVFVANPMKNAEEIAALVLKAAEEGARIVAFPELSVTGYTCADLFGQSTLLQGAEQALGRIAEATGGCDVLCAVGMPVAADNQLFNCAVLLHGGKVLAVIPKTFIPNYGEFYEKRWFAPAGERKSSTVRLLGAEVPFGEDILLRCSGTDVTLAVEICEDLWMPIPPSSRHALAGANVILNLSASNDIVTKSDYRRTLISQQSARCIAGYVFASAGLGESTTDVVFSGHSLIAENGRILTETAFDAESNIIYADMDAEKLISDRRKTNSFMENAGTPSYRIIEVPFRPERDVTPRITVDPFPFIPQDRETKTGRCHEIFRLQSAGLSERMRKIGVKRAVIGISGGLDSTLALLVTVEAMRLLGLSPAAVEGVTMPGMGTTGRTYQNAITLMEELGVTKREVPIREATLLHFRDIGHDPEQLDVTYENVQARERTQILMDIANQVGGLVVGTGDLSELALGWCTYNGDHISHYGVNAGVPKSLVRHLVSWYAETTENKRVRDALLDVLDTPISPELLPADEDGAIAQKTEDLVGPYELHDFFLYHTLRNGFPPKKLLMLAKMAFGQRYETKVILHWLDTFYRRFFSQQFKRSCLPDGVKVGSVCLSPRGDWRMPSDASAQLWREALQEAAKELE